MINKHKVPYEVLTEKHIKISLTDRAFVIKITIGSLTWVKHSNATTLATSLARGEIKASCLKLVQLVEVMKTFGGEQVIEFMAEGGKNLSVGA